MSHGLGRLPAPDQRDAAFPMAAVVPATVERDWRYWSPHGWWGDQGARPHCVGYAWTHWLEDGPVTHPGAAPVVDPSTLYREAQRIDEWPGEDYDGTSVRAGAKVLTEAGYVTEYRWAWDLETVVNALLTAGPVVMGTWWTSAMFSPDADGVIRYQGDRVGGHAWLLNGANRRTAMARAKNSWGRAWGKRGAFWIPFEDLERLVRDGGEACLAIEVRR